LDILGQDKEARFQINLALGLDPFFPLMHAISSVYFYHEGKFRESLDECRKTQELDPDYMDTYWRCFYIYVRTGEDLKAVEELQRIMQKNTLTAKNASVVKEVYNKSGIKGLLNWLIELELKHSEPNFFSIAAGYAIMSKKDEALNWLEKAFEKRPPSIPRINNDQIFNDLRSEPRFKEMIKKMGLSEYAKKE
jgi:tetratricopeptide (TPR) repeat protein